MTSARSPGERFWDPAAELAGGSGLLFWSLVAIALCVTSWGPLWHRVSGGVSLRSGGRHFVPDFFQDYASARNYYNGLDVYTDHDITVKLYVDPGIEMARGAYTFKVNAHPPLSILLALPLTRLDFRAAHFTWNLFSLLLLAAAIALIFRQLGISWTRRSVAPAVALILLSNALWENLLNGQYGCILLCLVVLVWAADRSGRPVVAGIALGLATAIKVFPVLLFVYLVMRKRWAAVLAGLGTVVAVCVVTGLFLGPSIFEHYMTDVYPRFAWFRNSWPNASLAGFWYRLFDTAPEIQRLCYQTRPTFFCPLLALASTLLSDLALWLGLWAVTRRAHALSQDDSGFALAVVVALLVSPITWPHYLVILVLPFAITWNSLGSRDRRRWLFLCIVAVTLFLSPGFLIGRFLGPDETAGPLHSVALFPIQCYAMLIYAAAFLTSASGQVPTSENLEA